MFGNLKDIYQLQSKAKEVQKKMAAEIIVVEKQGVKIEMNGNQEVLSVKIDQNINTEELQQNLKNAFNEAIKQVQQLMAKNMFL